MSGFQKCPKCDGTGKIYNEVELTGVPIVDMQIVLSNGLLKMLEAKGHKNECLVCHGRMIISCKTGLPPQRDPTAEC